MSDNYETWSIEDFAANAEFIAWVREEQFSVKWAAVVETSAEVRKRMDVARTLVAALTFTEDDQRSEVADVWERIEASTSNAKSGGAKIRYLQGWSRWALGAAAILLLLLLAWPAFKPYQLVQTDARDALTFDLPDQSKVILDDVSELAIYTKNWEEERRIGLKGTAFFEVTKGNTFRVETPQGSVTVLGTSFSVEARPSIFRVVCRSGRVQVNANGQQHVLEAGESALLIEDDLHKNTLSGLEYLQWIDGTYRFQNRPLAEVFAEMERQFDISIEATPATSALLFTGPFESGNLEKALQAVCWPMNLDWIVDGDTIIIQDPASI